MPIEKGKYGYRSLDELNYEYRGTRVEGLDMHSPDRDNDVDCAVNTKLKSLGDEWELDHILPGSPFSSSSGEQHPWPTLVFRKRKQQPA